MKNLKKSNVRNSNEGFTLIEILIVVAIIGILSSVVLVGLGPLQRQGRDARRISDLKQVQTGLELYYNKCGFYPGPVQSAAGGACAAWAAGTDFAALGGVLRGSLLGIQNFPTGANTGGEYMYGTSANGTDYVLGALLNDANNPQLREDIDGTVFGINCDDPVYCVRL